MTAVLISLFFLSALSFFNLLGVNSAMAFSQAVNFFWAGLIFILAKKIGRHFFQINYLFFYGTFLILTALTYVIGLEVKGSRRWINLYFAGFQPSEFLKIFFILFLATSLASYSKKQNKNMILVLVFIFSLLSIFLVFKQPDLGNALVLALIFLVILFFSGLPKRYIVYPGLIILLGLPFIWLMLKSYQKQRILSFLNPSFDTQGSAYNMIQAIITIGSGGFFGRGLGFGTQSRLKFLPENTTDFAFASLVEQYGFIGGLVVIGLFGMILIYVIKRLIKFANIYDWEGKIKFLYSLGFFTCYFFQIVVNIGMNLGLLPIAGIALPFISYGGSAIASFMIGLALLP